MKILLLALSILFVACQPTSADHKHLSATSSSSFSLQASSSLQVSSSTLSSSSVTP